MSVATLNQSAAGFKVADLTLADWGRKEISIAEQEKGTKYEKKIEGPQGWRV